MNTEELEVIEKLKINFEFGCEKEVMEFLNKNPFLLEKIIELNNVCDRLPEIDNFSFSTRNSGAQQELDHLFLLVEVWPAEQIEETQNKLQELFSDIVPLYLEISVID
jgi:hypothetical protein